MINYNIKNILLGVLIIISAFFFYKWYFSTDQVANAEIDKLKIENKKIEKERDGLMKSKDSVVKHSETLERAVVINETRVSELRKQMVTLEYNLNITKTELTASQIEIAVGLKQIADLKAHPNKRTGDDLLNSLNEKIMKK
jgi:O-succinylbenzoate synthase